MVPGFEYDIPTASNWVIILQDEMLSLERWRDYIQQRPKKTAKYIETADLDGQASLFIKYSWERYL